MRGVSWGYALLAVPAVAGAFFLQYALRKTAPVNSHFSDTERLLRPSDFQSPSRGAAFKAAPAGEDDEEDFDSALEDDDDDDYDTRPKAAAAAPPPPPPPGPAEKISRVSDSSVQGAKAGSPGGRKPIAREPVPTSGGAKCGPVEYRGDGPEKSHITDAEWKQFVVAFNKSKGDLLAWLTRHSREFEDKAVSLMENQMAELTVLRPPLKDEPDLTWRGIGVYGIDANKLPVLRIGDGLVKLFLKQPQRGKYEIARLAAQAWSPCEMLRLDAGRPWEPLLKCMGLYDSQACSIGSSSEEGWAIASVLASIVAAPGCVLPAYEDSNIAQCAKSMPLPLTLSSSYDRDSWPGWMEARR